MGNTGKIQLDELNDLQYDVLREIGNIGAGNATTALATMINMKIDMSVPKVALLPFGEISGLIGSEEETMVGILLNFSGDINGMMMFLLHENSAHNLVNSLMGNPMDKTDPYTEMELSALSEIGNIITGAYLSALSGLTGLRIASSVPGLAIDMAGAILSVPAVEFGKVGDKVLLIQTRFGEDDFVNGYFILIPDLESYKVILSSLGMLE